MAELRETSCTVKDKCDVHVIYMHAFLGRKGGKQREPIKGVRWGNKRGCWNTCNQKIQGTLKRKRTSKRERNKQEASIITYVHENAVIKSVIVC